MKKTVMIGLVGVTKDKSYRGKNRWERWRPTVSLAQQDDLQIHRFDLLVQPKFKTVCDLVATDIRHQSPESTVKQHIIDFEDPWDFESVYSSLHRFARSYPFDLENEEYLVHITTGTHVAQICLFILTESRHFPAKLIQTSPSRDYSQAPGTYTVIDLNLGRYDLLAARFERESREARDLLKSGIETRNQAFNQQVEQIEQVAMSSKAPILLMGPTGAGKSQLAKRIFDLKLQRHLVGNTFLELNCATLRGDAAMSALFGHKKGAFTGASGDRAGLLKKADGGLLFLDEIGELGLDEQAMLLRAVEEKTFLPVGGDTEVDSDFQLIAGTNRDLHEDVGAGRFREDLLSRLDLWTFHLPGLAERREDIEPNIVHELDRFAEENSRRVRFNKEAWDYYIKFATSPDAPWSGNFRDLNASITRMATLATGGRIPIQLVKEEIGRLNGIWTRKSGASISPASDLASEILGDLRVAELDRFELVQLNDVLKVCRNARSLSDAGRELFGASRLRRKSANDADRLRKYLGRFDLKWQDINRKAR